MMTKSARVSYLFVFGLLILVGWLHLATPFITVLFAYFALDKLSVTPKKWLTLSLFIVLVSGIFYLFAHFIKEAIVALPEIAEDSIPKIVAYANKQGWPLPFEDLDSLKAVALEGVMDHFSYLGNFAKIATKEFVFLVIGLIVAATMFITPQLDLEREHRVLKNNLYSLCCDEIAARFRNFYHSFATVMGAQMTISVINTVLTAIFVLSVQLPYSTVVIGITFLCGLVPIVGNVLSNAVIVGIGFTITPKLAIAALVFLIVLHKLQYFLNSKIIGDRIKNPVWLILLGLILGERLLGIPGLILAPVILNYVKIEAGQIEVFAEKDGLVSTGKDGPGARANIS